MSFKITTINYVGKYTGNMDQLQFRLNPPIMCVQKTKEYTLIIFQSKKCRIMGCRMPLSQLSTNVLVQRVQSMTVTCNIGYSINLRSLAKKTKCVYEAEIFPALRLTKYNPLCVNIFASGRIVVLGLKYFDKKLLNSITKYIENILSQ